MIKCKKFSTNHCYAIVDMTHGSPIVHGVFEDYDESKESLDKMRKGDESKWFILGTEYHKK